MVLGEKGGYFRLEMGPKFGPWRRVENPLLIQYLGKPIVDIMAVKFASSSFKCFHYRISMGSLHM